MKRQKLLSMRLTIAFSLMVVLLISVAYQFSVNANVNPQVPLLPNKFSFEKLCTYQVFTDGTFDYAQSCDDGRIVYGGPNNVGGATGTNGYSVIQTMVNNCLNQTCSILFLKGLYDLGTSVLSLPSNGVFTFTGQNQIPNGNPGSGQSTVIQSNVTDFMLKGGSISNVVGLNHLVFFNTNSGGSGLNLTVSRLRIDDITIIRQSASQEPVVAGTIGLSCSQVRGHNAEIRSVSVLNFDVGFLAACDHMQISSSEVTFFNHAAYQIGDAPKGVNPINVNIFGSRSIRGDAASIGSSFAIEINETIGNPNIIGFYAEDGSSLVTAGIHNKNKVSGVILGYGQSGSSRIFNSAHDQDNLLFSEEYNGGTNSYLFPSQLQMRMPSFEQAGNVSISSGLTTKTVSIPLTEPDKNYFVMVELAWGSTWYVSATTTTSFTINFGTAPGTTSWFAYFIYRAYYGTSR